MHTGLDVQTENLPIAVKESSAFKQPHKELPASELFKQRIERQQRWKFSINRGWMEPPSRATSL